MKRKRFTLGSLPAAVAAAALVLGAACAEEQVDPLANAGQLRVIHAAPGAGAVDVYVAGSQKPLVEDLAYASASGYRLVNPGTYKLEVRKANDPATAEPLFTMDQVKVENQDRITAVACGLTASMQAADQFRIKLFTESFATAKQDRSMVRIVHAAADAPEVAIDVGDDFATNPTLEVPSLAPFAATEAGGLELKANESLQIGIRQKDNTRVTAFTLPALQPGGEAFVIATGLLKDRIPRQADAFVLLLVGASGPATMVRQNPQVFALHASPDANPVDIVAVGADKTLVQGLAYQGLSGSLQLPPGDYMLRLNQAGTNTPVTEEQATGPIAAGERYLAIAGGARASTARPVSLIVVKDQFALADPDRARIRVVHAADADKVDFGPVQAATGGTGWTFVDKLGTNAEFGSASDPPEGYQLTPGPVIFGLAPTSPGNDARVVFNLELQAKQRAFAVVAGILTATPPQELRLIVVDTAATPWAASTITPAAD